MEYLQIIYFVLGIAIVGPMPKKKKLFDQFPPVTTEEWIDKIRVDLKGADFDKKLVWKTNEGFNVNPFYRMEDTENLRYIKYITRGIPLHKRHENKRQ